MCVNAKSSAKNRAGIVLGRLVLACPWLLPLSSPLRHLSGVCGLRICVHSVRTCCGQTHFRIHSQPSALSSNEGKNSTLAWHSKFTHNMITWMGEDTWLSLKRPGFALAVRPRFSFPMTSLASTSHPPDPHAVSDQLSHSSTTLLASTWQVLDQVFDSSYSLPLIFPLTPPPPATAPHPSRNSWGIPLAR